MTTTLDPTPDGTSGGADWAVYDGALTAMLGLLVAEASLYADRLGGLVRLHGLVGYTLLRPPGTAEGVARSADPRRQGDEWITAVEETGVDLSVTGRLSVGRCTAEVAFAVHVTARFPDSTAALRSTVTAASGEVLPAMTAQKLAILDAETDLLDATAAHRVEAVVLPKAATDTPSQFRARVRRTVIHLAPDTIAKARAAAVEGRRVEFTGGPDGTESLFACGLPAPLSRACDRALSDLARRGPRDGRTRDQRRADALMACILGPSALLREPEPLSLFDRPDDSAPAEGAWDLADLPPVFCGVPTGTPDQRAEAAEILALVREWLARIDFTLPAPPTVEVLVIRDERYGDDVTELDTVGPIDPDLATELTGHARRTTWVTIPTPSTAAPASPAAGASAAPATGAATSPAEPG